MRRFVATLGTALIVCSATAAVAPQAAVAAAFPQAAVAVASPPAALAAGLSQAQREQLHYPVWGMSPPSTADDTGGYGSYGVEGLTFPYYGAGADASHHPNLGLSQCHGCATEDVVTPHASFLALDVAPQRAFANVVALRSRYPDVYRRTGFFDALNPSTGAVGHRQLVLDQSMIMAALDNALDDRALQRHFASDPVSWAARTYLDIEDVMLG